MFGYNALMLCIAIAIANMVSVAVALPGIIHIAHAEDAKQDEAGSVANNFGGDTTITPTMKDVLIIALSAINTVLLTAVCGLCMRRGRKGLAMFTNVKR